MQKPQNPTYKVRIFQDDQTHFLRFNAKGCYDEYERFMNYNKLKTRIIFLQFKNMKIEGFVALQHSARLLRQNFIRSSLPKEGSVLEIETSSSIQLKGQCLTQQFHFINSVHPERPLKFQVNHSKNVREFYTLLRNKLQKEGITHIIQKLPNIEANQSEKEPLNAQT